MLFVEELRLANEIKVAADTAIIATVSRGSGSDNCGPTLPTGFGGSTPTSGAYSSSSNKHGNRRGICNCSVTGGQQQQQTTSQQGGPRPSGPSVCFPPMGYLVQQLSTAQHRHPRLLPQQQAHTMFAPSNFSTLQQQSWASPSPASPPLSRCRCRIDHGSWTLARPHICLRRIVSSPLASPLSIIQLLLAMALRYQFSIVVALVTPHQSLIFIRGANWWPFGAPPTLFSLKFCTNFLK